MSEGEHEWEVSRREKAERKEVEVKWKWGLSRLILSDPSTH